MFLHVIKIYWRFYLFYHTIILVTNSILQSKPLIFTRDEEKLPSTPSKCLLVHKYSKAHASNSRNSFEILQTQERASANNLLPWYCETVLISTWNLWKQGKLDCQPSNCFANKSALQSQKPYKVPAHIDSNQRAYSIVMQLTYNPKWCKVKYF